jgi:hypothetical protein
LLGIQALSLVVQIVGMAEIASRPILSAIWWILVVLGAATLAFRARMWPAISFSRCEGWALLPLAIVGTAIAADLLAAIAPSTKIDELYYHMLVPSRIVSDGALRFYLAPWEAAMWPHMVFQISAAPVHAIGYPDATNIVSWAMSVTLIWFAWCVIRANGKPIIWTAFWIGGLCVGLYPPVWQVTGGAHAMGDLSMAAAIVAFCSRDDLLRQLRSPAYSCLISVLLVSAATTKITLLPLSSLILCVATWELFQSSGPRVACQVGLAIAVPWLVFFCPIAIWTWAQSGSPFGPVLAGVMGISIYPVGYVEEVFQATRELGHFPRLFVYTAVDYSPLVWLGVIGVLFGTCLPKHTRMALGFFLLFQCMLIYWLMPYHARYLGGLHFGLLIAFACYADRNIEGRLASARVIAAASVIFLLPWLGLQAYYAKPFFLVSLGREKSAFYERYVPFYVDYLRLDRILSKNAVVLADFRLGSVYVPRPVFFHSADLPRGKPVVWFAAPETIAAAGATFAGYKIDSVVYENTRAVTRTYRTPGRSPSIGPLQVVRLEDYRHRPAP